MRLIKQKEVNELAFAADGRLSGNVHVPGSEIVFLAGRFLALILSWRLSTTMVAPDVEETLQMAPAESTDGVK